MINVNRTAMVLLLSAISMTGLSETPAPGWGSENVDSKTGDDFDSIIL
jgi:hypothetical protein